MNPFLKNQMHTVLVLAPLFLIGVFAMFYPPYLAAGDEHSYLTNAQLVMNEGLVQSTNEYYCALTQKSPGVFFSTYPIGKSIELAPFLGFGLSGIFWLGLITHLVNYILFILIFRRLKLSPAWALLYLFLPVFQWESRTLFPELSVLTFFLAAYWVWLFLGKRSAFFAGILSGLALFVRTDAFLGILAFSGESLLKERSRLIPFLAGAAIPVGLLALFNLHTLGSILPQVGGGFSVFGRNVGLNLLLEFVTFLGLLFIALPFSLLALGRKTHNSAYFILLTLFSCIFFVRFSSFWAFPFSIPLTFTARLRYFVPLLGMLIIPTAMAYSHWGPVLWAKVNAFVPSPSLRKMISIGLILLVSLGSMGATLYMHSYHSSFLDSRKEVLDLIHANIPVGSHVIGSADDCVYFFPPFFGEKKYSKVVFWEKELDSHTYILDISYATQRETDSNRQTVIDAERKKIKDFIALHQSQLEKVFEFKQGTWVTIWRVRAP